MDRCEKCGRIANPVVYVIGRGKAGIDSAAKMQEARAEADRLRARVAELEALTAENQRQCVEAQEAQLRLSQDIATERAARAQAEGRYESAAEMVARERERAEVAEKRIAALESMLREFRDNYDCDEDAHRYGTTCRVCEARDALADGAARAEPEPGAKRGSK